MQHKVKIAITGAAGQIGYALLFRLASGQMFGHNTLIELNLLELEATLPALYGIAMELTDCAFPLLRQVNISSDINVAMKDVDWALLIGSAPRKAGMERADLLALNAQIFAMQGQALNNHASPEAKILVVGNPCNTNCLVAKHHAPNLRPENFFAMTMLDELRAKAQLGLKAQVNVAAISHMNIWGNHSSSQFPDYYHAKINNRLATEVIDDQPWLQDSFISLVQQRGASVIKARGSSSAASAANAIVHTVRSVINETTNNAPYSIGLCAKGEYGVDPGLIYSFPCCTVGGQVKVVTGLVHNATAQQYLALTLAELQQEKAAVAALGLLN